MAGSDAAPPCAGRAWTCCSASLLLTAALLAGALQGVVAQGRGEVKPPTKGGNRHKPPARPPNTGKLVVEDKDAVKDLEIEYLEKVGEPCAERAVPGSFVSILHKGFVHKVAAGEDSSLVGRQIDGNPNSEPLNFTLRTRQIMRGMDLAIEGMCVGEKIAVVIPPHLAYDDPVLFNWESANGRPAPAGTTVRYEITLTASKSPPKLKGPLAVFAMLLVMVIAIGLAWLIARSMADGGSKAKGKKKKA